MWRILLSGLLLGCSSIVPAKENVWIIGGGPFPRNSQAQIEFNVNWVINSLKNLVPDAAIHVYYTNGKSEGKSVVEWRPPFDDKTPLQPLAQVFGEGSANGLTFRQKRVPDVEGSTQAEVLIPALKQGLAKIQPNNRALIIYNGHGLEDSKDAAGNTFRLWHDTRFTARQFGKVLDSVNPKVPVRFVLTQCYAGGFERAIHPQARDELALAAGQRCGFFAVSKDKEAEGCSPSINVGDYRDYTTYFFAALTGHTRLGKPIKGQPDLNHDGTVTPYEAHLYALAYAQNADIPQSTSELFLDRWQPWYFRWLDTGKLPDNVYGRLARGLAHRNGLPETGHRMVTELDARRNHQLAQIATLKKERVELQKKMKKLQKAIQHDLGYKWPQIFHPYTAAYAHLISTKQNAIVTYIVQHPRYQEVVSIQNRLNKIKLDILHTHRKLTQYDKILRLRGLARELDEFRRFASPSIKADYTRLLKCEQLPL
jgi:hypothetical protein